MFTSIKEYEKQLNGLNPEQKIKHIDNIMNELKEQFMLCGGRKKIRDIKSKWIKLENIRSCIKISSKPLINPCVESIIDGSVCRFMSDNESSDDEDIKIPDFMELHSSEKSSDYFEVLKYTIPAHYGGVFD